MADEEVVVNLTIDARASAQRTINDLDAISSRLSKVAQETGKVSDAAARTNGNFSGLGRLTEKIANDLEPWGKAARAAAREFDTLTSKIEALKAKMSRSEGEDKLLTSALAIVPQLKQRIDELKVSMLEASKAQSQFTSPEYLNRLAQAQTRLSAYGEALGRFKVQLDNSVVGMSSFANAQQMLANSANRMTSEFSSASSLMLSLTKEFNPGIVAAQGMTEKMLRLSLAYKLGVVDAEGYAKGQRDVVNSFNMVSPAAEKLINDLKRLQIERQKINQEGFKFQEQMAPSSNVAKHTQDVAKQQQDVAKAAKEAADRLDNLTAKYSQDAVAAVNYKKTMSELNEVFGEGRIGHQELSVETSKAIDVYNRSTVAGQAAAKAHRGLADDIHKTGLNTRVAQYAMTNFSFQINDVVSGLAMGQQPMRIVAQQLGQFVQIFQQIGRENIGEFFKTMGNDIVSFGGAVGRWLTGPVGIATAGIVLLSTALAVVLTRAVDIESQLRSLNVTLKTLGTNSLSSGANVVNMVPRLQSVGLSRRESIDSLQGVVRTQGINPQSAELISRVGANFAATFGGTAAEAAKTFANALAGGVDKAVEFALSINALTGREASNMLTMGEHGRSMQALAQIADRVDQRLKGNLLATLGPFDTAVLKMKNSWDALLDTLAKSTVIQFVLDKITKLIEAIDKLFQLKPPAWLVNVLTLNLGGAIGSGLVAAITPAPATPAATASISGSDNITTALNYFMNKGLTGQQSAGVVGRLQAESGMDPTIVNSKSGAYGIAQWLGSRKPEALATEGDLSKQLDLIWKEFQTTENKAFKQILNAATARNAAIAMEAFERAGEPSFTEHAAKTAEGIAQTRLGSNQSVIDPNHIEVVNKALAEQEKQLNKNLTVQQQFGMSSDLVVAAQKAEKDALDQKMNPQQAEIALAQERSAVLNKYAAELNNTNLIQDEATRGTILTADAARAGTVEMLRAQAITQATSEIYQKYKDSLDTTTKNTLINEAANRIMNKSLADSALAAQSSVAAMDPEIEAAQRLATAFGKGAAEGRKAELQNQAIASAQNLANAASAKGGEAADNLTKRITEENLARAKKLDLLKITTDLEKLNIQSGNEIQTLGLQIGLQGQTTAEIDRQVALLNEKLRLEALGLTATSADYEKRLQAVDAVGRLKIALDEATKAQQRLESGIKSIADTIDSTIGKSITDMFDTKKVEDWGTKLKSMFSTLSSSLVSSQITKPLIGTVLSGMGLTGLASQYGTFGTSLFGTSSTSTASSGSVILTPSSDGKSLTFSTVKDAAGAGKSIFDLFGSGASDIATSIPSGFTSSLNSSEFLFGTGLDFGGGGAAMGVADSAAAVVGGEAASGTSGLLGGLGLGGSGLSSVIPFVGPAIAVASLLIPMLFNKKPSNFAAGGNIDLSAGGTIGFKSNEGNSANTASANRIMDGISEFAADLIKDTGGQLIGNLNVQAGSRDGIKIAGNIGSTNNLRTTESILSTEGIKFSSESEAIELTSLAMVKLIEGVSDTMATVLDSITDLDDLAEAIDFANVYDSLKTAFDSAFADIEDDIVGPYADALVEIGDIFDGLTVDAERFGLSLEPINAGLKEANERLLEDFNKEVADAILALEDPTESLIQIEKEAGKVRISDAIAVGADLAEVTRLNGLYLLEIANDGYRSIEDFNKEINDSILELTDPFKLLVEQEKELGQARLDEAIAIGASIVEVNKLNALTLDDIWETQVENLKDLRDELKSGSLSGLTVGEQVQAANDNFNQTLRLVRGGDLNEVENLVTRGQDAFSLSEEAYGNAPQTAMLRDEILTGVDDVLASRSFAGGSESTPEGWIRVGENGPEWMKQSGGNQILPSGTSPGNDSGQLLSEVRKLNNLLEGGNLISREGFSQTIKRLEKVIGGVSKQTLSQPTRTKVA